MEKHFVTFEQAKLLKEKGFDEICLNAYNLNGLQYQNGWCEYIDDEELIIRNSNLKPKDVSAPEQWQVVEWLRVEHGIWIVCQIDAYGKLWWQTVVREETKDLNTPIMWVGERAFYGHHTPQSSISAAIDYILNNLI